jgi:REP element-mobilizing transposase RayT
MQSVPTRSPSRLVQMVKSLTAREVFRRVPSVKTKLWGGAFWSSGFFVNTVGRYGSEEAIRQYVREQGREKEYQTLHSQQLDLF